MTGERFEQEFCELLSKKGWWALKIPRDHTGAQPFDVISVKGDCIRCYDCKVISGSNSRFPLSRIEDNQWLAFQRFRDRTKKDMACGIAVLYNGAIYAIPHKTLREMQKNALKSIDLKLMKPLFTAEDIEKTLGYRLE